ncbi:MAG: hypothetical protein RL376_114 [Verrucomicrobiota bacterium]|jgi:hypothetical protein
MVRKSISLLLNKRLQEPRRFIQVLANKPKGLNRCLLHFKLSQNDQNLVYELLLLFIYTPRNPQASPIEITACEPRKRLCFK